jgi:hypothetical protein
MAHHVVRADSMAMAMATMPVTVDASRVRDVCADILLSLVVGCCAVALSTNLLSLIAIWLLIDP